MIIKRDSYLNQIIAGKENGLIKIITGIRRCGKSFLLFNLFYDYLIDSGIAKDHIIKVAFDDWNFRELCNSDKLMEYIKGRITDDDMHYILLDEVQLLNEFVPILNGLLRKRNVDLYITGSNSHFLSNDIATEFRGRGDQIHVYPLSFAEFMSMEQLLPIDAWPDYYTYG